MIFTQWYRRFRRARALIILGLLILGALASVFADPLGRVLAPTCAEPPTYHADVPDDVRGVLDSLFDNDLLYCAEPSEPFAGLDGPIYWGSDGLSSWVFFQADNLRGVGLTRYAFGEDFAVTPPGDSPPASYNPTAARSRANQATAENPTYFFRRDGAPSSGDARVALRVRGPQAPTAGRPGARSVWRDLDRLIGWLRGDALAKGTVPSEVLIARQPEALVQRVERRVAPGLADEAGELDKAKLAEVALGEPVLMQAVTGMFGNSVWVAGVVTDTVPALELVPPGGGEPVAPFDRSLWRGGEGQAPLALFAFDPLTTNAPHTARFWLDGLAAGSGAAPDAAWPVEFP